MLLSRFSLMALLCISSVLLAQEKDPDHYQVYGGYTFLSNSFNGVPGSRQPLNGWDASLAFPAWRNLRFKMETFGYIGTNLNAPQHAYFIMGGGQYGRHFGREFAFVEALVGEGGINPNWGANATSGETASFATLLGGGLDTPITRRLAFRVDAGYQWSNFALAPPTLPNIPYRIPGLPNNFARISTGCVWRF
jgi:hypothetical protein